MTGRARAGGSICPACRVCADHGLPHVCITSGDDLSPVFVELPADALQRLREDLEAHPAARPVLPGGTVLEAADSSWCFCGGCRRGGRVVTAPATRSASPIRTRLV